jgi:hypothetical protein
MNEKENQYNDRTYASIFCRSPDEFHHRTSSSRGPPDSPSIHFQRSEGHTHHV